MSRLTVQSSLKRPARRLAAITAAVGVVAAISAAPASAGLASSPMGLAAPSSGGTMKNFTDGIVSSAKNSFTDVLVTS